MLLTPVILAGGSGTRLWPVSRDGMPKQFLPLIGARSTYQQALARVADPALFAPPVIVTNEAFRFFALQQAAELGLEPAVVLEPARRDSAAAIAAGAAVAAKLDPEAVVLAMAADHVILDDDAFLAAVKAAHAAAAAGHIVTFGIRPTEPKTAYGYIKRGGALSADGVFRIAAFVEKPDAATAARYVAEGYLWNSGNFVFRAGTMARELTRFQPELSDAVAAAVDLAAADGAFLRLDAEAFGRAPRISIDYAVMEKTDAAAVVESQFRWSDIGSWDAVFAISPHDEAGNVTVGETELLDVKGCLVHGGHGLTALVGVENLVVVTTPNAVLVADRAHCEDVKALVSQLEAHGRREASEHRRGFRPWGYYDSVDCGERFQVKRIVVQPGRTLSLQRHLHRAEHWVVVRGTAEVTINDTVELIQENQSIFIPSTARHRLANPGKIPLEIIEVQTGSYLGEDDITRFDDVYNRT
ncbi:mannose-1-phosphate guanylyltransferase/mannose-6-phosphate isomerase [Blastochloris viridis]|uniref:mannose-1-phosphate guanylyltransferase n=1 Tax=Blastochloris viridis TaxID=1079 RepID=A0A0H5BBJ0_BLAVI|nr:mannose-1-phosphate guanylyltransferase/mannose-6-phosphate isomerase [Blastochloris viridis]ALK10496.1 Alginate biosynthesis protein AlgA [Blastochloris viridis]BAR99555.1 mannose-1-phosphate guanylyltransferase [Blastochloris viridis]CUU43158.1 Alginate biosynthesis protein AlgA [Blastochloris viridis]